jgi:cytochrome P450
MVEIGCEVSTAIYTVLMAAACFPSEQAKVQAELDQVIGRHRGSSTVHLRFYQFNDVCPKVPTFADQHSLPYLQAFISEALRWRPLTPSGVYHCRDFVT